MSGYNLIRSKANGSEKCGCIDIQEAGWQVGNILETVSMISTGVDDALETKAFAPASNAAFRYSMESQLLMITMMVAGYEA